MPVRMEVTGLEELRMRMRQFPQKYSAAVRVTLRASLLKLHENVEPYPAPPPESTYERTGTLGRTLGSGMSGGNFGQPDIFDVFEQGGNMDRAEFGTRLGYAPFVIGEKQAENLSHWWTMEGLAEKSKPAIIRLFQLMAKKLARFLDGKGLL